MNVFLAYLALGASFVATALLLFVAYKARHAHRSLWKEFEAERLRQGADKNNLNRQWQLCYGRLVALERGLPKPVRMTAQAAEDVFLLDYFHGRCEGTYVDVGAYDGIALSNTYALSQLGWRGLLVEANPANAKLCRENRPLDIVEHCAVGGPNASGMVCFTIVEGEGAVDTLSFVDADAAHRERCLRENGVFKPVSVPFVKLDDLLKKHAITSIDVLSLDIEGGEIEALQGLHWEEVCPRLVLVEANSRQAEDALKHFFGPLKYRLVHRTGMNLFFEYSSAK